MDWWPAKSSRARASARVQPSTPLKPHYNRLSVHWPCVKSLSGGRQRQISCLANVVVSSIMVVGTLIRCALLHSVCDYKTAQMNGQLNLIRKLKPYEFELGHNAAAEAANKYFYARGEEAVDHCTITKRLKTFHPGYKNHDHQARSGKPKVADSMAVLEPIETSPTSRTRRVSGELGLVRFVTFKTKSIHGC